MRLVVMFVFQPTTDGTPWFKTIVSVGVLGILFDVIRENRKKREADANVKLMKKRNFIIWSAVYMASALCLVLYTVFERLFPEQMLHGVFFFFGFWGFFISVLVLLTNTFRKLKG